MEVKRCNFCGSTRSHQRYIDYLYSHQGQYLLVPNTPVEVCDECGMIYYQARVLKEIEHRFFAIQEKKETPDRYITLPEMAYT